MKKHIAPILAIILTSLFLFGCQRANTADSHADETDKTGMDLSESTEAIESVFTDLIEPEQLLSKAEAEDILGLSVKDGEKTDYEVVGQKICFYEALDENAFDFLQISITQQAFMPEGQHSPADIYHETKTLFEDQIGTIVEALPGLGDDAILSTGGYYILYKGYYLAIFAGNTLEDKTIARLDLASGIVIKNLDEIIN